MPRRDSSAAANASPTRAKRFRADPVREREAQIAEIDPRLARFVDALADLLVADLLRVKPEKG